MAKINTTNYHPVTAWNGTQDLLIVEQPDGTKVATPEQVKQYMDAFMDDEPTEGSEEAVKSGGVFSAIDDSVSLKTATGNPITLTDAANANAEELSMTIEPVQSGSGDPSPTNVRPISGLTSGEVQTTNGTDTNTATITLGQTVYGGSVNFKTGEVTVTHGFVEYDGSVDEEWDSISTQASNTFRMKISPPSGIKLPTDNSTPVSAISNQYLVLAANSVFTQNTGLSVQSNGGYLAVYDVNYNQHDSVSAWKAHLASEPLTVCYELATPTTLTLTPAELELLKGNNTITANGAEISIEYYPDNAIGALAERVDNKADITYVDNAVDAIKYLTTSNTSFADAGARAGIQYGADFADIVNTRINDLSTGIFMLETSGPKLGVVLFKYTNVYYSGIILNYFAMNERKPLYFVYQDGTYGIRTL